MLMVQNKMPADNCTAPVKCKPKFCPPRVAHACDNQLNRTFVERRRSARIKPHPAGRRAKFSPSPRSSDEWGSGAPNSGLAYCFPPGAKAVLGAPVKGGTGGCKYACLDNRARGRVKHPPPNRRREVLPAPKRFAWLFPVCPGDNRICGGCGGRGREFALGLIRGASSQLSRSCEHGRQAL